MFARNSLAYQPLPLPDRSDFSDDRMRAEAAAFLDRMQRRHTVRQFSDRPVPQAVVETCIRAAGTAPSGANHQPWHFVAIADPATKHRIREAAEAEERAFYAGAAGDEWLAALEPIGTGASKPHLTEAPWLIVVFAQRHGVTATGERIKHYYVPESVGIAIGMLITALHMAGLVCLPHTPNPMKFLGPLCGRPAHEKPMMILPVGWPADTATVPAAAKIKKPRDEVLSVFRAPADPSPSGG